MPELKATLSTLVIEKLSEDITVVGINAGPRAECDESVTYARTKTSSDLSSG